MKIKAIKNHIIFQFVDAIDSNGQFIRTSESGIWLGSHYDDSAKDHRWGKVISAGPNCSDEIKIPGCEVLIENLRWTESSVVEGQSYWKTDETQLLCYRLPGDKK